MEILTLRNNIEEELKKISDELHCGELVIIPTETVYGLAADATNERAVKKIFAVKNRPMDNPLIVHVCSLDMLEPLVKNVSDKAEKLMCAFWPGALTIILEKTNKISDIVTCGLNTVAVRMPSHSIAKKIIEYADLPLAAPSANISGRPSSTDVQHCLDDMGDKINIIVDGGRSDIGIESTVISLVKETPTILRPGMITKKQIEAIIGPTIIDKSVLREANINERVSSPGMKYRHYAPKTEVVLVEGDLERFAKFVNNYKSKKACAMVFMGESKFIDIDSFEYGDINYANTLSYNLFHTLREIDKTDAEIIFVRNLKFNENFLGVYNRLLRAAEFKTLKV